MNIQLKKRPENLEEMLKKLAPWGHYFKFDDTTITGFFTAITDAEGAVKNPELTYCTDKDDAAKIELFNKSYKDMIVDSKRQFMLIDVLEKIMGSDFNKATVYDFGCNDGMKTFYYKTKGVKKAVGFEYREDCIKRANYINSISDLGCEFVHYPISAESQDYANDLAPAEIVSSFGVLHHLKDHKTHIEQLFNVTKNILVLHVAFTNEEDKDKVIIEHCTENSFKSVTGERIAPTKKGIIDILYKTGFSYVLEIKDHPLIDTKGFESFTSYLVAVK